MVANGILHAIYSTVHDDCLEKRRKKEAKPVLPNQHPIAGLFVTW